LLRATAVPEVGLLLRARIGYGNSVCPTSVTTRYGFKPRWDRDSAGLHHIIIIIIITKEQY